MAVMIHGILALLGVVLLALGIKLFISSREFVAKGIKTTATVIDNVGIESDDNKSVMYSPMLEYQVAGETKKYMPNMRANPPSYDIGEQVQIVYRPNNHQDVRILSYWGVYLGTIILLIFSLPILIIGAGYFLFKWGFI